MDDFATNIILPPILAKNFPFEAPFLPFKTTSLPLKMTATERTFTVTYASAFAFVKHADFWGKLPLYSPKEIHLRILRNDWDNIN